MDLMVSTEASWWNILQLKIYIVSRMCEHSADDAKAKHVSQVQED